MATCDKNKSPITRNKNDTVTVSNIHYHSTYELYYLLSGKTSYFVGDNIYHICEHTFVFIPKGVIHKTDNTLSPSNERILVDFDASLIDSNIKPIVDELSKCTVITIPQHKIVHVETLLFKIEAEAEKKYRFSDIMIKLYIKELLVLISRYKDTEPPKLSSVDSTIDSIAEYIRTNYSQNITLDILCEKFNVSKYYLSRRFKEICGIGLIEYLNSVRITNAEQLLRNSDMSVSDIAYHCGFNDSNYFAAVFKKLKGISPLKYSKSNII